MPATFRPEPALSFAVKEYKDKNTRNSNCACCFIWEWNLVCDSEGRKQAEGVLEYDAKEGVWTEERRSKRVLKKTA